MNHHPRPSPELRERIRGSRIFQSADAVALLVVLIFAALVRTGLIAHLPW